MRTSPAVAADGTLYAGSDDGRLYAVDAEAGVGVWEAVLGKPIRSSPAIGQDGTIYVGCEDGYLYAIG